MKILIRRADQRVILFIRNREHDAIVGRLKNVGEFVLELARHDDVAAPDQSRLRCVRTPDGMA